jgi:GNAT superfamily N-acetyltransferase
MNRQFRIEPLADHPEALPVLKAWFETEWGTYYGPNGPGDAAKDLSAYSNHRELPIGLVALCDDELCGIAALKPESITIRSHLSPWAAAGLVIPRYRGRGIGTQLLGAVEEVARGLGYAHIYAGTSTAPRLLERRGWQFLERVRYHGDDVSIYEKAL